MEIGIVGKDKPFTQLSVEEIKNYIDRARDFKASAEKMDVRS